jgi:cation:H+ antiporter
MLNDIIFGGLAGNIILVIISIIVLMICAEIAVKKVLAFLKYFGYSTMFGGLVIFSIATSFPEIFSHLAASFGILSQTLDYRIASATVLGANIGSDVIQQTLVLGIVVLLMGSLVFKKSFLLTAYLPMIGTTLLTLILGWDRTLSRLDGAILLITFLAYMVFLWKRENHKQSSKEKDGHIARDIIILIAAMVVMLFSANFLLKAVHQIVFITGLGGSLIGVVSLGVAAAAPELFTAISGLRQKAVGISLGTLIGSNITNPLVGIGLGSLISTYWVPRPLIFWDLPMETITAALLLAYLLLTKRKLGRVGALYLIALYFVYLAIRIMFFYVD